MATKTTIATRRAAATYSPTSACRILKGNSSRVADLKTYRDIKARDLTPVQAGEILGIKQPHVSPLRRNRSGNFSVERLMDFLTALGHDVETESSIRHTSLWCVPDACEIEPPAASPSGVSRVTRHMRKRRLFRTSRSLVDRSRPAASPWNA
jgi:predicted XRE-type DNA-binding protein